MDATPILNGEYEHPIHMDVELSTKCNLRCRFCHLDYFDPKEWTQFSLKDFERTIGPALPHLNSITLFNKFEALTCRDFLPIFNFVAGHGIETYFSTNGLLLNDEIIDQVVGRLNFLTVSVTGFTSESYRLNMGFNGLMILEDNLTKLRAVKAQRNTDLPRLRISTVGMLDTIDELSLAVDFAKKHQAEEGVQLTSFKAHGESLVPLMPMSNPKLYTRMTENALAYAKKMEVRLTLQSGSLAENKSQTQALGHRFCDIPWRRLSIQPDGEVYPCPMAYAPIASLAEMSIKEIWDSAALAAFRAGVNDHENMNEDCLKCTHCRHRSLVDPEVNDFSKASTYPTGMVRKR